METENNSPKSEPPKPEAPKQTKKFQILFLGTIVCVLIILFLIGIIPRIEHWKRLEEGAAYVRPITANILTLTPSNKPMELILPSSTEAKRITPIWSRSDGYIENFLVDIGDNVEQGQLILEIATPELDKQLAQAKADLVSSLANLEIADITATRWKDLLDANQEAVSGQEVDEKKANFQAVLAGVESAKANVQRLEAIRGFNKLYAPFKGIITQRNIEIGTLVSAGSQNSFQQLFQIAETDIIRVFVDVPQNFYRMIQVGGEADIRIQEFPDKVFKGVIARTSRSLDPLSRTLLTEIHVNNKDGVLIIGLYAQVYFESGFRCSLFYYSYDIFDC